MVYNLVLYEFERHEVCVGGRICGNCCVSIVSISTGIHRPGLLKSHVEETTLLSVRPHELTSNIIADPCIGRIPEGGFVGPSMGGGGSHMKHGSSEKIPFLKA